MTNMNIKLFLIVKALNVLPSEIIKVIYKEISSWEDKVRILKERFAANFIKRNIRSLAYKKFNTINSVFLKLCEITNENDHISSDDVIKQFLIWKRTVNPQDSEGRLISGGLLLYIDAVSEWSNLLNTIRYKYFNQYISQLCSNLIIDIRFKKREYKIRVGRFFASNATMSTKNYIYPWIYREDIIHTLLQNYRSIYEVPGTEFISIINTYVNNYNLNTIDL